MKTSPTILKKRIRYFPALLGAATASLLFIGSPAHAGYIVTLEQVGLNVVETGIGAIDLTGLTFNSSNAAIGVGEISPGIAETDLGSGQIDEYTGISGPLSFGAGGATAASTGSGDHVGLNNNGGIGFLFVPHGYTSNTFLSGISSYNNATFSSLGATPGTYEWTWGTGLNQNFTLEIGPAGVPDAGSTIGLLILALAALLGASRALRVQSA
jgi:hypothetical protein